MYVSLQCQVLAAKGDLHYCLVLIMDLPQLFLVLPGLFCLVPPSAAPKPHHESWSGPLAVLLLSSKMFQPAEVRLRDESAGLQ